MSGPTSSAASEPTTKRTPPNPTERSLWTVDEVAGFLGVSTKTVRKWQLGGTLPFVKLGGKLVRFQPDTIRAWADERAVGRHIPEEPTLVTDLRRRLAR